MCLFNAFASGACFGAALHSFTCGNTDLGLLTSGLVIINLIIAIVTYIEERN